MLREGVISGLLGAAAVAVWFFVIDIVSGRPFGTPLMLGRSVASLFGGGEGGSTATYVLGYTVVHVLVFVLVGLVVAAIFNNAESEPSLLIGFLILFVAFEVGWYGWTALLAGSENFGQLAWYQVLLGNLVATAVMGAYMWRAHPGLFDRFSNELAGGER